MTTRELYACLMPLAGLLFLRTFFHSVHNIFLRPSTLSLVDQIASSTTNYEYNYHSGIRLSRLKFNDRRSIFWLYAWSCVRSLQSYLWSMFRFNDVTDYSESQYDKPINTTPLIYMIQSFESYWCVIIPIYNTSVVKDMIRTPRLPSFGEQSPLWNKLRLCEHGYPTARSTYWISFLAYTWFILLFFSWWDIPIGNLTYFGVFALFLSWHLTRGWLFLL